jgi:hypothetical protein
MSAGMTTSCGWRCAACWLRRLRVPACQARDLPALVRCADAYVQMAERFAACFTEAIPPEQTEGDSMWI